MRFQAAIFDMDGVLVDSEIHWGKVEKELWGKLGVVMTPELSRNILGKKIGDILRYVKAEYGGKWSFEHARRLYIDAGIPVYTRYSQLLPGVQVLLDRLRSLAPIALGSSSPFEWITACLYRFHLENTFARRYSTESMNIPGKPDPTLYRLAIEEFDLEPKDVVIFEDSPTGFEAAYASGATVVAVPDPRWSRGDFSRADFLSKTLADPLLFSFLEL